MSKVAYAAAFLTAVLLPAGCSRSNVLLLGRVEAQVGTHRVAVTDCYRFKVPPPGQSGGGYRFTPCADADILIGPSGLTVNGRFYGKIGPADDILVDHGVVSIRPPAAAR